MDNAVRELARTLQDDVRVNVNLAPYARVGVGGPADILYVARSREGLIKTITTAQKLGIPWRVYGGLTNVLLPDSGLRGLVIINHMRAYRFTENNQFVAESGVNVVKVAREAVRKGIGGLTWAVGLPGTIGGAVVNNAGAFGGEISRVLTTAEIYSPELGIQEVGSSWFEFQYRNSKLKSVKINALVINTQFTLKKRDSSKLIQKAEEYTKRRQHTQPAGKTLGSTFKNPEGDYAGRLIESAGLKGTRIGGFIISEKHANFFINVGDGSASDYRALIRLVKDKVSAKFGICLETEIEIIEEEPMEVVSQ
jgi:UDP-N-acetylmuramate dehydrogenase